MESSAQHSIRLRIKREIYSSDSEDQDNEPLTRAVVDSSTSSVKLEDPSTEPELEDEIVDKPKKKALKKRRTVKCIRCGEMRPNVGKNMCNACYFRERNRTLNLDKSKMKVCTECNKSNLIVAHGMCENCYQRMNKQANKLAVKNDPLRNHKPKIIPKIEMETESEDDLTQSKDVSSDDEEDSKTGIKMEIKVDIKCEPST